MVTSLRLFHRKVPNHYELEYTTEKPDLKGHFVWSHATTREGPGDKDTNAHGGATAISTASAAVVTSCSAGHAHEGDRKLEVWARVQ